MDRQLILDALLADGAIAALVTVDGKPQVFLWMTPNAEIFPRIVVRELDVSTEGGADDGGAIQRIGYEVAFTVKMDEAEVFTALCGLIPAALARIELRHVASTPDQPIPEHLVVSKTQQFETYVYVGTDEDEEE